MMKGRRWQDVVMLVLGLWLIVSPFVLNYIDYTNIAALNSYILGVGVIAFAAIALTIPQMWEEWVNLVLGVWLLIAPFVLGFQGDFVPMANHLILGVLIAGDALWAMYPTFTRKAM
jgi:hypothetical protein